MTESEQLLSPVPLTLLLVDDQAASTQQFKEDLTSKGYLTTVVQIISREALILWLQSHTCDVVVANHRVPGLAAIDVLEVLQHLKLNIPVVLLSSSKWDMEKGPLLRAGAVNYISPEEVSELVPMIERELRLARTFNTLKADLMKEQLARQSTVAILKTQIMQEQDKQQTAVASLETKLVKEEDKRRVMVAELETLRTDPLVVNQEPLPFEKEPALPEK